jgi:hypothetical protein
LGHTIADIEERERKSHWVPAIPLGGGVENFCWYKGASSTDPSLVLHARCSISRDSTASTRPAGRGPCQGEPIRCRAHVHREFIIFTGVLQLRVWGACHPPLMMLLSFSILVKTDWGSFSKLPQLKLSSHSSTKMPFIFFLLLVSTSIPTSWGSSSQRSYCETTMKADVVTHVEILSKSVDPPNAAGIAGPSYIVRVLRLFKSIPNVRMQQIFRVHTSNPAISDCRPARRASLGRGLKIGGQYVLSLKSTPRGFTIDPFGQNLRWQDITQEQRAVLERGGECCSCSESQECRFYEPTNEYYCADVCTPNRCPLGSKCELKEVASVRAPCPPVATCTKCPELCPNLYNPGRSPA